MADYEADLRQSQMQEGLAPLFSKWKALEQKYAQRDSESQKVRLVRNNDWSRLAPMSFNEDYPAPIVANLINRFCETFGASVAPLPSFQCSTGLLTDKAKKAAEKRTQIVNHYFEASRVAAQMLEAGDGYASYGAIAAEVEPNQGEKRPQIRMLDSAHVYPVWDRNMRTVLCAKASWVDRFTLCEMYSDVESALGKHPAAVAGDVVRVVKIDDGKNVVTFLPDCGNHVLSRYKNLIGRCSMVVAPRPHAGDAFEGNLKGAYTDLIWPQLARHEFQMLALEGSRKTVEAPLAVPNDVSDVPFGPDAVIHTQDPQGVKQVQWNFPAAAFQATQVIAQEMREGGGSPEAMSGNINASVITGKGVDSLMQGYNVQIAAAQEMFKLLFAQLIELCFRWDEKVWPDEKKTIHGSDQGAPYSVTYVPSQDIDGQYGVDIQYGFLAGLDANRALVYLLQARGDGLISREYTRAQLPGKINAVEEERRVQLEQLRDAQMAALASLAQEGLAQLAGTGQDPTSIVQKLAEVERRMKKGDELSDVLSDVFAPPPPPEPTPGVGAAPGEPGGGAGVPGGEQTVEQTLNGGGRPSLQQLFAGLSGAGNPQLSAGVSRMLPTA